MLGALIGAASSLVGGLFGKKSADKANKANAKAAKQANKQQRKMARENIALQKEFAKNSLQWKAADAKKAGIHPLYAMGAQGYTFNPVQIGSTTPNYTPDNALAAGIAGAGQDIGRAVDAQMNQYQRTANILSLQRMGLENELLATQIAKTRQAGQPPPFPTDPLLIDGQGATVVSPHELTSTVVGEPSITAGAPAETTLYRTKKGYAPGMSEAYQEGMGESVLGSATWGIRNYIAPYLGSYEKSLPPPDPGKMWVWNPIGFEYVQTPIPNYNLRRN